MAKSEKELEDELLAQLSFQGYERVDVKDEDSLLINLKLQLEKFNNIKLSQSEFKKIQIYMAGGSVIEKAKKLRDKFELLTDKGNVKYIKFLDDENIQNNIFQVTNQLTMQGLYENRYDVTILINGIPMVQIELKKKGVRLKQAFQQIERYKKHSYSYKALFQYIQIFVISNEENTRYFSNNKTLNYNFTFPWADQFNLKKNNLKDFTKVFLDREHLANMLTKYIVINESIPALMILRPYQYYAVEKIVDRVKNHPNENGYIWHTTGSGKTLTSFKASQIISKMNEIDKVVFCVDRKDLDYQTTEEFNRFSPNAVNKINNTQEFVDNMLRGSGRGGSELAVQHSGKLVVTTLQKLNNAISKPYYLKQMEKIKDSRIVFIFDECHRTQFGDTHARIKNFFTNKQFFGFTGTPIFAENAIKYKTTKDLFDECLHKYTIKEAIDDENVLGFSVEYYSTFNIKDSEGNDLSPDEMIENGINTKEVFSNRDRLENIVDFILKHHKGKTSNRTYQSIFAINDIDTLIEYYHIFKEKNTDLKIAAIFTYEANADLANDEGTFDPEDENCKHPREHLDEIVADYNRTFGENIDLNRDNGFNNYFINISKKVKERKIDILLVVNMFLTGFDSKYLNTLYVDKNLKHHGLIQAYSRTNRILNVHKPHGNIVCFRNLKKRTDEAIKLFSDENAQEIVLMKSYQEYLTIINRYIADLMELVKVPSDVDTLESEKNKIAFIEIFKNILRTLNKLMSFNDFDFNDINIDRDLFDSFKSKYQDMYESLVVHPNGDPVSIINDIDFEIELLRTDNINVSYILSLLNSLNSNEASFVNDVEYILKTMENTPTLKNKKELIEKFIRENREIFNIEFRDEVEDKLAEFLQEEKRKAIEEMINEEELKPEAINSIIDKCEFTEKGADYEEVRHSFIKMPGILTLKPKVENIQHKIANILDKFNFFHL